MKKSQVKDATRNIRKRIVSYLSICLVIMLGVGAFLTTRFMEAGLGREAGAYEIDHNFKNFEMISSLGVSESNLELVKQVDGVLDAEGVMQMTATISKGYSKRTATVLSATERISVPELVEGRMPTGEGELALAEDFSEKSGIGIGDNVRLHIKVANMDYPFRTHKFVITGLVRHPDYIHRKMSNIVVAPLSSFDEEVTDGLYTRVYIKSEDPSPDEFYSDKYLEESRPLYDRIDKLAKELEAKRTDEFKRDANAEIDAEWAKALAEFEKSQAKIDNGRSTLNSKLAKGRKKLNKAQSKLDKTVKKYKKKIDDGEARLNKIKANCNEIDKQLPEIKKDLKETHEKCDETIKELDNYIDKLSAYIEDIRSMTDEAWNSDEGSSKREEVSETAKECLSIINTIEEYRDKIDRAKAQEIADKIKEVSDGTIDPTATVDAILNYDFSVIKDLLNKQIDNPDVPSREEYINTLEKIKSELEKTKKNVEEIRDKTAEIEKNIDKYEKEKDVYIANAEKKIKDYRARLEKERKKYQNKIDEGWNKYHSVKRKYEAKLAEAIALLAENREEAEKKLEEARAEVDKADCKWLALDRKSNAGYIDIKSQIETLHRTGTLFGIMFLLITAMVCLSTLIIIIDEQKTLIGTVKAFGFHKGEVLGKYLIFGVTAAIVGDIMAFIVGTGLSEIVLKIYNGQNMYPFENLHTVIKPGASVLISLAMVVICALATVIACSDILKSPASMLMNGNTLSSNKAANKRKKESTQKGSLYSKLIVRNIKDDKARVIVSTVIVAACCMLMGLGITVKLAFGSTLDKQSYEINNYDLKMDFAASVSDEDKAAIDKLIADSGAEYIETMYENRIYRGIDGVDALNLLCAKPEEIKDYIGISLDGEPMGLPADGILLPLKFGERYSFRRGDNITIFDNDVVGHDVKISDFYNSYFGRLSIITPEAYRTYFGEAPVFNSRYVHLNGADSEALRKAILKINSRVTFDTPTSFRQGVEANAKLFSIVTLVTTGIAILISFMILTNLANIFLNRKKTELSVMRVNGFSVKQAKGYLARETVITSFIGLFAGVLIGSLFSSRAIQMIEPINMQLDRSYQWMAWVIAAALEGIFALIIYTSTFRKVKNLDLRDIA